MQTLGLAGTRRPRLDRHAFDNRRVAGRGQLGRGGARKLEFDQTDAARTGRMVDVIELAQRRDVDAVAPGAMQNGLVFFGFDGQAVDRGVNDLFFFALGRFMFQGGGAP